jgi:DUF1365 family protein
VSTGLRELSPVTAEPAPVAGGGTEPAGPRSAIYEGWVFHRRIEPVEHTFRYRIFMPLVDLDELPALFERTRLWSADRRAPARFRRSDYLRGHGDALPLAEAARDLVAERTGARPAGPVRMLANPRYWGVGFNPVSFYYLDGADGAVETMIAEVTSTPWKERRSYVLSADADGVRGDLEKRMHVSPFMPMEQRYEWRASDPGEQLTVTIRNRERGRIVFEAGLALRRREMTRAALRQILFRYPPMTVSTIARIYWNAARLKAKGAPYFQRPAGAE